MDACRIITPPQHGRAFLIESNGRFFLIAGCDLPCTVSDLDATCSNMQLRADTPAAVGHHEWSDAEAYIGVYEVFFTSR